MNALNKYFAIASIAARSNLAYAGEVGSRLFFLGVILFIFMRLWQTIFANSHQSELHGYNLAQMIWYLALTESIMTSAPRVTPQIDEDVRTGTIAVQLVRPLSYPLYRLSSYLGERFVRFGVTLVTAALIAAVLVPVPAGLATGALYASLAIPLAFVLDFLGYLLVGLSAFWLEDTIGVTLIYSRLTMIAGGMMLPLSLFPGNMQAVLNALPFGYVVCGPSHLLVHPQGSALLSVLAGQVLWIALYAALTATVYHYALKRIALNGG